MEKLNAITVQNLGKKYRIGSKTSGSLRQTIANAFNFGQLRQKKDFWALMNVSFTIQQGEIVGIIGRNGAGKSTLLKILSKITIPTKGKIEINGRLASLLEVGTGFHPELTGRENIFLNGSLLGMTRQEIQEKFAAIVAFSEIGRFIETPVKHYSSGMYVRLAFSIAIHLEPEILLIDEVLAVGDFAFQKKCISKLQAYMENSKHTVVVVSHDAKLIKQLCQKVFWLEKGQLRAIGETVKILSSYLSDLGTNKDILKNRLDRLGNGEVRLVNVDMFNEKEIQIDSGQAGEFCRFEFSFEKSSPQNVEALNFEVRFYKQNGSFLFSCSSLLEHSSFEIVQQHKKIALIFKELPLRKGNYYLTTVLKKDLVVYDAIIQAYSFECVNKVFRNNIDLFEDYSGVIVPYTWEIP